MSTSEQELKRVLHYGYEVPFYQPGDRVNNEFYHSRVSTIVENLLDDTKASETVHCIVKAFSDGYSPHPSMLVYALAVCAKKGKNQVVKEAAYKAVKIVCSSTENFFLFIKYAIKLSQNQSIWGSGFRKVCKEWYLKKDAKTLAEIVTKHKQCHGWSHKDIIKLIHLKPNSPAQAAVVKYVLFGIKAAKKDFGDNSECTEVINYLQAADDLKHTTDEQQAARSIEMNQFTIEHVPFHLLKSKEVWCALVPNLSLPVLLDNLQKMSRMKVVRWRESSVSNKVVEAMKDKAKIAESYMRPAQILVSAMNYQRCSQFWSAELARKKRRARNGSGGVKRARRPPSPNDHIQVCLNSLFEPTGRMHRSRTGLKYFIGIDLKSLNTSDKCYRCPNVCPLYATVVTVLCFRFNEEVLNNVFACVSKDNKSSNNILMRETYDDSWYQQSRFFKEEVTKERMKITQMFKWSLEKKEQGPNDIFIYMSDSNHEEDDDFETALKKYREEIKAPNVKLIIVLLKSHTEPTWVRKIQDPGIFVIGGFDGNVPRLIEAFSRGAF